ncbi:MAG: ECF transporter S component [Candidatus Bathyarchaeia archaeon]
MRTLDVAATALNAALYTAFGYLFYYILPLTAPGLGLVRFWPQVIIPAAFAALFGPWVGGIGAAIGIFISDMLIHGNPILSLMAGVTSNFAGFFIIGYVAKRNVEWKIPMLIFGIISALLVGITQLILVPELFSATEGLIFSGIILGTYAVLLIVVLLSSKWRSYEVGCMIGLLVGSAIIGTMVPVFSQMFVMPGKTELTPLTVSAGLWYLVWTFSTEIPFLIILGPPILEACQRAFPALKPNTKE